MKNIREAYKKFGVDAFYKENGNNYINPHIDVVRQLTKYAEDNYDIKTNILDLCCGSGEVTLALSNKLNIIGNDPYTRDNYIKNTGRKCLQFSFDDIQAGLLKDNFDTVFCSFALHLCEQSKLQQVLWQLSLVCEKLIIITPHKRPDCNGISFRLIDEVKEGKCKLRLYTSKNKGDN